MKEVEEFYQQQLPWAEAQATEATDPKPGIIQLSWADRNLGLTPQGALMEKEAETDPSTSQVIIGLPGNPQVEVKLSKELPPELTYSDVDLIKQAVEGSLQLLEGQQEADRARRMVEALKAFQEDEEEDPLIPKIQGYEKIERNLVEEVKSQAGVLDDLEVAQVTDLRLCLPATVIPWQVAGEDLAA